jgi:hypothetical protein
MMNFILTVHSVSPILIHTVTLITLRSYSVPVMSCPFPTDILFVESFQPLVTVEESQLLLTTSFLGNSGQVVQYISAFLCPL